MPAPKFDTERAAKVLALALTAGDSEAAKHFGISAKSVSRYRQRSLTDASLSALVFEKTREFRAASEGWAEDAAGFMSRAIRKLDTLVGQAGVDQIRDVAGAIKIVGELDITQKVLGSGEQPSPHQQGPVPPEAAGADGGGPGTPPGSGPGAGDSAEGAPPVH
jgi:hypothetical protein